jgi:hypothetical protein
MNTMCAIRDTFALSDKWGDSRSLDDGTLIFN